MSNSLLDKYKKSKAATEQPVAEKKPVISHDTSSASQGSALSKLMASKKTSPKLIKENEENVAARKEAEQEVITTAKNEVPEGIFELNDEVLAIDGLDADYFTNLLVSTHTAIVEDEPILPRLLEEISSNMRKYEELVYLLKPEQLALFVDGTMTYKSINIKTTAPKKSQAKNQQDLVKESGGSLQLL